tara:strand:+ start:852 stop:992 length:141 start_codon:yes stop_codon:yes gene_type:complete
MEIKLIGKKAKNKKLITQNFIKFILENGFPIFFLFLNLFSLFIILN